VVVEVGENNIVHIVTDNGSNYKKACPLAQKMAVDGKTSSDMYIQLHLLASHILTSKLMTCSHHLQVHGGKCSVTRHLHFRNLQ
jgi:hypothetical protein